MSSNFVVNRICESCGEVFQAKTTVTRFCSSKCNKRAPRTVLKRAYKQKLLSSDLYAETDLAGGRGTFLLL